MSVICGKTSIDNGRKLDVHHVYRNKEVMCNDDERKYFVPLCKTCHGLVRRCENKNNFEYRDMFINLIHEKGRCYYSIEEYLEKFKGIKLKNINLYGGI